MASDPSRLSASDSSLSADLIAQRGFASARRGFDPDEVRAFLGKVAKEFRSLRQLQSSLEELLREAEYRAAHPTWDDNTLLAAVGDETASILRSAHAAAADIKGKAEDNASRILKEAQEQSAAIRTEAETTAKQRTEEAETTALRVREQALADAERMRDTARQQAEAIRSQVEAERKAVVEAAQTTRERILADLSRRRLVASTQIEQLRAGRERLLEAYRVVRATLDDVTDELSRVDGEARAAAEAVGRKAASADESADPVDLAEPVDAPAAGSGVGGEAVAGPGVGEEAPGEPVGPTASAGGSTVEAVVGATADEGPEAESVGEDSAVGSLFARIRADREDAVARAHEVLAPDAGGLVTHDAEDGHDEAEPARASRWASGSEIPGSDEDEAALQRRDEAVATIEASLARRLKRALQDEQNDLLDKLRNVRGHPTAAQVLPARDAHAARFAKAGRPALDHAAKAGAAFINASLGQEQMAGSDEQPGLDDLAAELAEAIIDPLRRRLEEVFESHTDDDAGALAESLGVAYREWKTQRIELTASDHVASAFARGAFAATPGDTLLRWVVEDVDGPCPDCDDNALAGDVPRGDAFPTGQQHPPAHAGCRCLLVPKGA
ncbi:MAG TPA: DivIVA domain-containing protein [Acidimicrobiales bacterium]